MRDKVSEPTWKSLFSAYLSRRVSAYAETGSTLQLYTFRHLDDEVRICFDILGKRALILEHSAVHETGHLVAHLYRCTVTGIALDDRSRKVTACYHTRRAYKLDVLPAVSTAAVSILVSFISTHTLSDSTSPLVP